MTGRGAPARGTSLDVGCGEKKLQGALGLDIVRTPAADVIADAMNLPFRDEVFDYFYASHVLEHFGHSHVEKVLREWMRVLKTRGTIEIKCPDLRARAFLFSISPSWDNVVYIYGRQNHIGNFHKSGFSYGLLRALLTSVGVEDIRRVIDGYKGIPFLPNQLHVLGTKSHGYRDR